MLLAHFVYFYATRFRIFFHGNYATLCNMLFSKNRFCVYCYSKALSTDSYFKRVRNLALREYFCSVLTTSMYVRFTAWVLFSARVVFQNNTHETAVQLILFLQLRLSLFLQRGARMLFCAACDKFSRSFSHSFLLEEFFTRN